MRHFHPNDPDTKPLKLAATTFWWEELEPIRGMMLDGCADIEIDGFGNWVLGAVTIGQWTKKSFGSKFFTGTFLIVEEVEHGQPNRLWDLIRAELVRKYDDDITQQCVEEAEG